MASTPAGRAAARASPPCWAARSGVTLSQTLSPQVLEVYGWRIAFLLGALTLPFGLYIRRSLPETLHIPDHLPQQEQRGFFAGLAGHTRPIVLALFVFLGGTVATLCAELHDHLRAHHAAYGVAQSFSATLVNGFVGVLASLGGGLLSDFYGRRLLMVGKPRPLPRTSPIRSSC
ncbi:MAG: hypothetical protein WDN03_00595 [Rhizomicrobium sp.]